VRECGDTAVMWGGIGDAEGFLHLRGDCCFEGFAVGERWKEAVKVPSSIVFATRKNGFCCTHFEKL